MIRYWGSTAVDPAGIGAGLGMAQLAVLVLCLLRAGNDLVHGASAEGIAALAIALVVSAPHVKRAIRRALP
jgi:hypothetical protein